MVGTMGLLGAISRDKAMVNASGRRHPVAAGVTLLTAVAAYARADRMGQQMTTKTVANGSMADRFASGGLSTCDVIVALTASGNPHQASTGRNL
jgi:hypothetical protein